MRDSKRTFVLPVEGAVATPTAKSVGLRVPLTTDEESVNNYTRARDKDYTPE